MCRIVLLKPATIALGFGMIAFCVSAEEQPAPSSAATNVSTPPVATAEQTSATNPIVTAPGPVKPPPAIVPTTPRRHRAISPDVAAQLSAATPKFTPPAPKPPPRAEEEEADLREIDKPKNGIIRLPKYIVREPTPPVLTERAVNTKKGLQDLAMKRYVSEGYRALNRFYLPLFGSSMENYAMQRYWEEERLGTMSELNDLSGMVSATDRASGYYVKKQADQATMRAPDFDWRPIGR